MIFTEKKSSNNKYNKPARLKDIAKKAKVDISIVSRVLNNKAISVRSETRERIFEAAKTLGYKPDPMGRGLRQRKTMTLGLILPDISKHVYYEIIRGARQESFKKGYALLLASANELFTHDDIYHQLFLGGRVDGVMVASSTEDDILCSSLSLSNLPYVLINRRSLSELSIPHIIEDDESGMGLAVKHLIDLGHEKIAHISGPQNIDTGQRRLKGFKKTMEKYGLSYEEKHIVEGNFTERDGFKCMKSILSLSPRPTSVAVSSIYQAIGAMSASKLAGVKIPEDISLVTFHDFPLAEYLDPPLTTIQMPVKELGEQSVRSLLRLINSDESIPNNIMIDYPPKLIIRKSTALLCENKDY